jgi:hypothetical protein
VVPQRFHNLERARALDAAWTERLVRNLMVSDPLADAAIDSMRRDPSAHARIRQALDGSVEVSALGLSPELIRFVEEVQRVPDWVDWNEIALGARTYQRLGGVAIFILATVSLMRGYHSSAINKPLALTGRLDGRAERRLAETGKYIAAVTQVDGLRAGAEGFAISAHVRLMHAQVRRMLLDSGRWDVAVWGLPINQTDLASTGLAFSIAVLVAARQFGFEFDRRESEALMHLWRYASHLMGLTPELQWETEEEAELLGILVDLTQPGADEHSVRLSNALRSVVRNRPGPASRLTGPLILRYFDGLTRHLNGDAIADDLEVPRHGAWALGVTRMLVVPIEGARRRVPALTPVLSTVGNVLIDREIQRRLRGDEARFELPLRLEGRRLLERLGRLGALPISGARRGALLERVSAAIRSLDPIA